MSDLLAPVAGTVVAMQDVPDPVFSAGIVGEGLAIEPEDAPSTAIAPIDGTVVKVHPHAFVITGDDGLGVLVHLGIDTVQLNGEGFEVLVSEGDRVAQGDPMISWNPPAIREGGRSAICPVVLMGEVQSDWASAVEIGHSVTTTGLLICGA
ncbi:PTS sugar transporter subunit IIA [Devriesea agamarum]|uniref:PTS sugar transporter subunit IIA n=1 Tax=Devriesea agamarum TaxID=472569 RepID=UPI00071DCD3F|nr:PTS glucose transporter subunit IIA [Devriesea agamarum]